MPALSINRALDAVAKAPEAALAFIQKIDPKEWSVFPMSATLPSFLVSYAKVQVDASEFLNHVLTQRPPSTDGERKEWKEALFACLKTHNTKQENGVVLWSACVGFLNPEDKACAMTLALCKDGDPWDALVEKIAEQKECNWNQAVPDVLFKENKGDTYMSGQRFNRGEARFLQLARSKNAVVTLIKAGVQVDQSVLGKTLRQRMVDRSVETFAGADQRKAALAWLEKEVPREWNQATAWEAVASSRQAADIDRVLIACKKDWPTWRGPMGETMAHHVAMYAPEQMAKVFKRPEAPKDLASQLDDQGLDVRAWWVAGMGRSNSSLTSTHCDLDKLPQFKRPENTKEAAMLSLEAFLAAFNPGFATYGSDVTGRYQKQEFFKSMRSQSEMLGLHAMPLPAGKEKGQSRYPSQEARNMDVSRHSVALDELALKLIGRNEWNGAPAPEGRRALFVGALAMRMRAMAVNVRGRYTRDEPKTEKWQEWGHALARAPSNQLSAEEEKRLGEYLAWNSIKRSVETKAMKCEGQEWNRAIESGVNPHELFALLDPNTQKELTALDWEARAVAPWERKKLQERATQRMSEEAKAPTAFSAL